MSKYRHEFCEKFKDTNSVKKLTKEIKDALDKKRVQREVDLNITGVCKGKYKRRNK